ncbi:DUF4255 domain-containing protein [Echinicola jeungdonensis]|uniref:DUF4255 domain-containing protein n=1 Tax=Echinicola jeungdonensis TaxID=709343 RepID=A0ABV5J6T9_9BACT|nr:DUF4255 domain-containing protein [Echinicola jeungdonensis]MDN3670826.1 DUF4255 domain-containing protein [Echinicola jeungdonensis]
MVFEVLKIISEEVNQYFTRSGMEDSKVILENIALIESQQENAELLKNKVVLSLINFKEETTLKNFPNHQLGENRISYKQSKVNLNLFLIFCANRSTYNKSLKDLSKILEFFQHKKVFTQSNTEFDRDLDEMSSIKDFRFTMELFTPTFEELNYIWGTLGGRQLPSVYYKLTLIEIERDQTQAEGELISTINRNYKQFKP